jgi:large subunit ribosomal protein L29
VRLVVKRLKAKDLEDLTAEELASKLADLKSELFNLRFQHATGQLDNPIRLRQVRRDIARVKTVERLREMEDDATRGAGAGGRAGAVRKAGGAAR